MLNGSFQVNRCDSLIVSEFADVFQDALVTDLADGDLDAAQVEDNLAQQPFLNNIDYLRLSRRVHDYFLQQAQRVQADVFLQSKHRYLLDQQR